MKKILFILLFLFSCTNTPKYELEYGIITSVEKCKKYNSIIQIYTDAYRTTVEYKDTTLYIIMTHQPKLGDSIPKYIYRSNNEIFIK